jgi:hypothetical protein
MNYLSYLTRLERVDGEQAPLWRASLQRPGAAEMIYFAGVEALVAFEPSWKKESLQSRSNVSWPRTPGSRGLGRTAWAGATAKKGGDAITELCALCVLTSLRVPYKRGART